MPTPSQAYPQTYEADQFAELARRYADMVYGTCLRVTRNVHDAEDAAQECFLRLLKRGDTITTSAAGWLHTTAVHCSVGLIRKASTRRRHEAQVAPTALAYEETTEPSWEDIAAIIDGAIDGLADPLRVPLVMHYLDGLSQMDIAAELGVSQSTISRRIERALAEVSRKLKKAGLFVPLLLLAAMLNKNASAAAAPASLTAALGKMAIASAARSADAGAAGAAPGLTSSTLARTIFGAWRGKAVVSTVGALFVAVGIAIGLRAGGHRAHRAAIGAGGTGAAAQHAAHTGAGAALTATQKAELLQKVVRANRLNREQIQTWAWVMRTGTGVFAAASDGTSVRVQELGGALPSRTLARAATKLWGEDFYAEGEPGPLGPLFVQPRGVADPDPYDPRTKLADVQPRAAWDIQWDDGLVLLASREPQRTTETWLAPGRGYAPVRRRVRGDRNFDEEFVVEQHDGVWFPMQTRRRLVDADGNVVGEETELAEAVRFNARIDWTAVDMGAAFGLAPEAMVVDSRFGSSAYQFGSRAPVRGGDESPLSHSLVQAAQDVMAADGAHAAPVASCAASDPLSLALALNGLPSPGTPPAAADLGDLLALANDAGAAGDLRTASWGELKKHNGCAIVHWGDGPRPALLLPAYGDEMVLVEAGAEPRLVSRGEFAAACAGSDVLLIDGPPDEGGDTGVSASDAEGGVSQSMAPSDTNPEARASSQSQSMTSQSESAASAAWDSPASAESARTEETSK